MLKDRNKMEAAARAVLRDMFMCFEERARTALRAGRFREDMAKELAETRKIFLSGIDPSYERGPEVFEFAVEDLIARPPGIGKAARQGPLPRRVVLGGLIILIIFALQKGLQITHAREVGKCRALLDRAINAYISKPDTTVTKEISDELLRIVKALDLRESKASLEVGYAVEKMLSDAQVTDEELKGLREAANLLEAGEVTRDQATDYFEKNKSLAPR